MPWHYVCWKCINAAIMEHRDHNIGLVYLREPTPRIFTLHGHSGEVSGVYFNPLWKRLKATMHPRRLLDLLHKCDRCKKWRHSIFEFYDFGPLTAREKKAREAKAERIKKRLGKAVPLE